MTPYLTVRAIWCVSCARGQLSDVDRRSDLKEQGFDFYTVKEVGLPIYVRVLTLDLEVNRALLPSEEAILSLLNAGITSGTVVAELLGIGAEVFSELLINVMRSGAVALGEDTIAITQVGRQILKQASLSDQRRIENFRVIYNPHWETLKLPSEGELLPGDLAAEERIPLELDANLSDRQFLARLSDLQVLIGDSGRLSSGQTPKQFRVVRASVEGNYTMYLASRLELWWRESPYAWQWLLPDESPLMIEALLRLEEQQVDGTIIPRHLPASEPKTPLAAFAARTLGFLKQKGHAWLGEVEAEAALIEVIRSSNERLVLVSSFLNGNIDVVLGEVLGRLAQTSSLRVELTFTAVSTRAGALEQERLLEGLRLQPEHGRQLVVNRVQVAFDGLIAVSEADLFISGRQWQAFAERGQVGIDRGGGRRSAETTNIVSSAEATLRQMLKQVKT